MISLHNYQRLFIIEIFLYAYIQHFPSIGEPQASHGVLAPQENKRIVYRHPTLLSTILKYPVSHERKKVKEIF